MPFDSVLRRALDGLFLSAAGALIYLGYLWTYDGQGLHPFLAGLCLGCLVITYLWCNNLLDAPEDTEGPTT